MEIKLNLLVLRCRDLDVSKAFYEQLGFSFEKEQHGSGPMHYVAELDGLVFELYPLKQGIQSDQTRLGFRFALTSKFSVLLDRVKIKVISTYEFQQQKILVIQDPDGRKVELSQSLPE